jgi:SMC interacting uncharacterized protein involved in chromosome segregation
MQVVDLRKLHAKAEDDLSRQISQYVHFPSPYSIGHFKFMYLRFMTLEEDHGSMKIELEKAQTKLQELESKLYQTTLNHSHQVESLQAQVAIASENEGLLQQENGLLKTRNATLQERVEALEARVKEMEDEEQSHAAIVSQLASLATMVKSKNKH